jgi:hypothetical protein
MPLIFLNWKKLSINREAKQKKNLFTAKRNGELDISKMEYNVMLFSILKRSKEGIF